MSPKTASNAVYRLLIIDHQPANLLACLENAPVIEPVVCHDLGAPVGMLQQLQPHGALVRLNDCSPSQLSALRDTMPDIPIVAIAARADEANALRQLDQTVDDYLLDEDLSAERLAHVLRQAGKLRAAVNGWTAQRQLTAQLSSQLARAARGLQLSMQQNVQSVNRVGELSSSDCVDDDNGDSASRNNAGESATAPHAPHSPRPASSDSPAKQTQSAS